MHASRGNKRHLIWRTFTLHDTCHMLIATSHLMHHPMFTNVALDEVNFYSSTSVEDGENGLGCFFLLPKPLHSLHVPFCLHCFVECNNTVFNPWQCSLSAARCRKSNSNYKFNSSTIYRETTGIQWVSCMFVSAMTFILNIYQPSFPGCFSLSLFCAWWMQATTTTITTKSNWVHSGGWEQS